MENNETVAVPELIVMLTHNDLTVADAEAVFESCKDSSAKYWGMKEEPLPLEVMKRIYDSMHRAGKTTVLEVVAYTEEEGLRGARIAAECGCDILMGTKFFPSIAEFCKDHQIKYMPFVGTITGRPSVLSGTIDEIIAEAEDVMNRGAFGVDLLGYRYVDDPVELNKALAARFPRKVCIAGSINSFERLDEIKEAAPESFTIGGAFFENRFPGGSMTDQINSVCDYLKK